MNVPFLARAAVLGLATFTTGSASAQTIKIDASQSLELSAGVRGINMHRGTADARYAFGHNTNWRAIPENIDGTDWRSNGRLVTLLEAMEKVRDHNASGTIVTSVRISNPASDLNGAVSPAKLAANQVRYVNHMLQQYRSSATDGSVLYKWNGSSWVTPAYLDQGNGSGYYSSDYAIAHSIEWRLDDQGQLDYRNLFIPLNDPPTPRIEYWEVGNEPEHGPVVSPLTYANHYVAFYDSIKAADPNAQVGPTLVLATEDSRQWLDEISATGKPMDFVAYHPYDVGMMYLWLKDKIRRINFQPTDSPVPAGYIADDGSTFASRNGEDYGWSTDLSHVAIERDAHSDQRYDTAVYLMGATWEIEVPNGFYEVVLAAGDPSWTNSINNLDIEGTIVNDPDGYDNFDLYQVTVEVQDGRLSISVAPGFENPKLLYVEITGGGSQDPMVAQSYMTPDEMRSKGRVPLLERLDDVPHNLKLGLANLKWMLNKQRNSAADYTNVVFANEWNPVSWQPENARALAPSSSMLASIGVVESVFTFAEQSVKGSDGHNGSAPNPNVRLKAANYWDTPDAQVGNMVPVFERLQDHINPGDMLLKVNKGAGWQTSCQGDVRIVGDNLFRLYALRQKANDDVIVWAMNFADEGNKTVTLDFDALPPTRSGLYTVTRWTFKNADGDTSLVSLATPNYRSPSPWDVNLRWVAEGRQRLTASQLNAYSLMVEDATMTTLTVHPVPLAPKPAVVRNDFDGDRRSDFAYIKTLSSGAFEWHIRRSMRNYHPDGDVVFQWGSSASPYYDTPITGDYDGDGKVDMTVVRRGTPKKWYVWQSSTGSMMTPIPGFGNGTDPVVSGDYDGDGIHDLCIIETWRSPWLWYMRSSANGIVTTRGYGNTGDDILAGDYDGDGQTDIGVRINYLSPAKFYILRSGTGSEIRLDWGYGSDIPLIGDYDGDNKSDVSVLRWNVPNDWYIYASSIGATMTPIPHLGNTGETPIMGDYDGDGKYDPCLFGNYYIYDPSDGGPYQRIKHGSASDYHLGSRTDR